MKTIVIAILALCLDGCAIPRGVDGGRFGTLPVGTHVLLRVPLEVAANHTRVFIQNGRVSGARNEYAVFCAFELRMLAERARQIEADDFLITAVRPGFTEVVMDWRPRQLASATDGYSPAMISRYFHYRLGSARQPDVMRLSCYGAFDDPPWAYPPTIAEIRATLQGIAELQLP